MAQLTKLEILNKVLRNRDSTTVENLNNLNEDQQTTLEAIYDAEEDIAMITTWKLFKRSGQITLIQGALSYGIPSNFYCVDPTSFIFDDSDHVKYIERIDAKRLIVDPSVNGSPIYIYQHNETNFRIYKIPTAADDNKLIKFDYYEMPTLLTDKSETGNSWIPEPFDRIVLVPYATFKRMTAKGDPESERFRAEVFGNRIAGIVGSLKKMKRIHEDSSLPRIEKGTPQYDREDDYNFLVKGRRRR